MKISDIRTISGSDKGQELTGLIFDVQSYAIHDGPGVRTLVFMKGCPLRCWWCHNPEGRGSEAELLSFESECIKCYKCLETCPTNAISLDGRLSVDREKCTGCGLCPEICPTSSLKIAGRRITVAELMAEIEKYNQLYSSTEGGVTFSGGEPLFQPVFLQAMLKECKKHYIHTAIETSGYTSKDVLKSVMSSTDLFLYDLKLSDQKESRKYTGVPTKLIRDNLKFLIQNGREVILRFPIIPGITDTESNVKGWVRFLSGLNGAHEINLLPYHDVGEKFNRLGVEYRMNVHKAPHEETLKWIRAEFEKIGLKVKNGG